MDSIIETIARRVSTRTFSDLPIGGQMRQRLADFLASNTSAPFDSQVRFQLIDLSESESAQTTNLATYGVIRGAKLFIVGAVERAEKAMQDYGYCMEKNVLLATSLGLGTCWLGGFFNRSLASSRIGASENDLLPGITPVGYAADRRALVDSLLQLAVRPRKRRPWARLFFREDTSTPLKESDVGEYAVALESVRLAPSASNLQPWRVIATRDPICFHFFLRSRTAYNRLLKDIQLQNVDMGIAMCHFELSAHELGLKGGWRDRRPDIDPGGLEYVVTWSE